ncbi:hypothetical protein [Streptomyces sp. TS71-3]|uniref:hypothetical protein n=1 Tax=Streptomyces sp. TS71-3 TaxID=2733862 RepID=UPI001B0C45A5|nr:hypothetical protein [Streptomyces sp. TS71-3]GHJ36643.1 hypothetical protein Sm713_22520 [Streptomyces sp. TS71-3]
MDELTFDGVPFPTAPVQPLPDGAVVNGDGHVPDGHVPLPVPASVPVPAAVPVPPPGPVPDATPPFSPALRIAAQIQRAHAAVLDAHEAITAWQLARAEAAGTARSRETAVPTAAVAPPAAAVPVPVLRPRTPPAGPVTPAEPMDAPQAPTEAQTEAQTEASAEPSGRTEAPPGEAAGEAPAPPPPPTGTPETRPTPPDPVADEASKALRTLAAALHTTEAPTDTGTTAHTSSDTGTDTGTGTHTGTHTDTDIQDNVTHPQDNVTAITLTWRRPAPQHPTEQRVTATDGGWQVVDGAGPLAEAVRADGRARSWPPRPALPHPPDPRPLARARVDRLAGAELDALAEGRFGEVFGAGFDQGGGPPDALPARWPARLLDGLTVTGARDGAHAQGRLLATTRLPEEPVPEEPGTANDSAPAPAATAATRTTAWAHMVAAALEALRVHAFRQGLHLCVPGARAVPSAGRPVRIETLAPAVRPGTGLRLELHVSGTGMLPLPYATADCEVTAGGRPVARLWDLGVTLQPGPGVTLLGQGAASSRTAASGRRVALDEFQIAFMAEGDHGSVRLPGLPRVTARVRPRLPRGDLRMADRMTGRPAAGGYRPGARGTWEYDVPEDPWFVRENNGTMPQLALMETALQPAGGFSGALGVSGEYPDTSLSCRNLTGRIRLLADVALRSATVEQRITLRAHSPLPDGIMHRYDVSLHTGGVEFCTAEAVHGYLTPRLLEGQQGLDGDAPRHPWLDDHPRDPAGTRRLRLADDARLGTGRLALLDEVCLVPGGGVHGAGYALCEKPVRPDDWFFEQHFPYDPVLPGSVSVQMLYQAVHAFALHTGLLDHLREPHLPEPRMSVAVGEDLRWNYRGQILREHHRIRGEVHIRRVERTGDRLLVCADGSVWRDGTRIYEVDNIAADFHAAHPDSGGSPGAPVPGRAQGGGTR